VGRKPLLRDLERAARSSRRLDEEVDDRAAAQGRDLLDLALGDLDEGLRRIEDERDLFGCECFDTEKVRALQIHRAPPEDWRATITTESSPSVSRSRTSTISLREVGTFFPT